VAPPAAEENSEEMARKRESSMVGLIPSDKRLTSESAGVTVLEEVAKPRNVVAELCAIGDDIGECTRCRLSKGRKNIVFGTGNEHADLMFVGEGPGADEDEQGLPFVGRAGQLLNNMIAAMGLRREDVYIANVVKCRPPGNRTPERDECETCIPFLMRQIAAIRPKVIVALGATAAKNLLAINSPMGELRGRWYDFRVNLDSQGRTDPNGPTVKLAVTYHPAFLLRDPRQKKETWKDLQMVMKYLGLKPKTST
jgi:DNA polymerase